ncbi:MAG: hypothetical protein HFE73_04340 [Firmicutes bacterium]|nr:hypothetical protein [Bacillota bacterium]
MHKITYHYSALPKQTWFYAGILYLVLSSIVSVQVEMYRVPGFYESQNLLLALIANGLGMIFFFLLSFGHYVCYAEYDDEKIVYHNRLLRKTRTFFYKDATAVIFDKRGVKFYDDNKKLANKEKPLFFLSFFRDGKIEAIPINQFYQKMQQREAAINEPDKFKVYKTFKVLPGYGRNWKYLSFAYACLTLLVLMNCMRPLAVILGLMQAFS